jgi:hypothetical protein
MCRGCPSLWERRAWKEGPLAAELTTGRDVTSLGWFYTNHRYLTLRPYMNTPPASAVPPYARSATALGWGTLGFLFLSSLPPPPSSCREFVNETGVYEWRCTKNE